MIRKKIFVSIFDIGKGHPKECSSCPIALAIRRTFEAEEVFIYTDRSCVMYKFGKRFFELPKKAIQAIIKFDHDKGMKPFTFVLKEVR